MDWCRALTEAVKAADLACPAGAGYSYDSVAARLAHELGIRGFAIVSSAAIPGALDIATRYGGIDGAHHKTWAIDQMVRALTRDEYEKFVADAKNGEDGPDTYEWDEGIAP